MGLRRRGKGVVQGKEIGSGENQRVRMIIAPCRRRFSVDCRLWCFASLLCNTTPPGNQLWELNNMLSKPYAMKTVENLIFMSVYLSISLPICYVSPCVSFCFFCSLSLSDILVLKIILILVFIQFLVNNFYFSFSFSFEIILVSISVLVSVLK